MNLYLFEWCYEDGQRWEIIADSLEEAMEYFLAGDVNTGNYTYTFSAPIEDGLYSDTYRRWYIWASVPDGRNDISIIEKPLKERGII